MQKNSQSPNFGRLALAITAGAIATQPILCGLILPTHANWAFLFVIDSTHLGFFGEKISLPCNYPLVVLYIFDGIVAMTIGFGISTFLIWCWGRFKQRISGGPESGADAPNSAGLPAIGPGTVSSSDRPEQRLIEAESKIENEALKVPDSKVLQDDLNSL